MRKIIKTGIRYFETIPVASRDFDIDEVCFDNGNIIALLLSNKNNADHKIYDENLHF